MVIVKLMGGVGNQMFQYALARHLAEKNQTDLKIDLSFLLDRPTNPNYTLRDYQLGIFNIQENFAEPKEVRKIIRVFKNRYARFFSRFLQKLKIPLINENYIIEKGAGFNLEVLAKGDNIYLEGFWQSEKYFSAIEKIIRQEFTLKPEFLAKIDQEKLAQIRNSNSVSLSIRRGDYISNQAANSYHGMCSIEYYQAAVKYISAKVDNPIFFVTSDDIEWCRENIKLNYPTYFIDGKKYYQDLFLASQCKHNVIANSSFSWWAAWLNANPNKTVIAPKQWFANKTVDYSDIVPTNWIKI